MAHSTRATQFLQQRGVTFTLAEYDYDPGADHIGMAAAAALGVEPGRVLKTLMASVDGKPVCAVVPSDCEVSMKKLAAAAGGKAAAMMKPADAERLTGYRVGGISPFGQKKQVPTVLEERVLVFDEVYLNGGQRGLQVVMAPNDIVRVLNAVTAALSA
jgi:Cys-tRNA(Pro)/Cys-tRNA(Cys) deacylase